MRVENGEGVITVIVVSWNVREYLGECLRALLTSSGDLSLQVIVVDNGSVDGTVQMVKEQYPEVEVIALPTNVGFPAANNVAIRRATGRYVLFLNPDTVVQRGCLQKCIGALERDPTVGMSGCRLIYPDGSVQYECAASLPSLWDVPIEAFYLHMLLPRNPLFGRLRMSYWDHMSDRLVTRISGAFMMIRSDVLVKVGMMDERIFMYYEDIDLCARVTEAGWRIQYISDAVTIHYGGRSAALSSLALDELAPHVRYTYFLDHKGRHCAYLYRAMCVIQSAIRIAIALLLVVVLPRKASLRKRPAARVRTHWRRLLWGVGVAETRTYPGNGQAACDALLVGPLPPPMNGMTVMTAHALGATEEGEIRVRHFDISDHRHVENVGRLDLQNVLLALSHAVRLFRATRKASPKLVILQIAQSRLGFLRDAALFLAIWCGGARSLVYLHGATFDEFYSKAGSFMRRVIQACFRTVRGALVLTPSARLIFGSLLNPDSVRVVPNGIPEIQRVRRLNADRTYVHVLFLSNLSYAKGYRDALAAAALAAKSRNDIRFTFAGAWQRRDEERWARDLVKNSGVEDRIDFRGRVVGLRKLQLLDCTDIFCFTPRFREGQPVVLLEAMRHGIPCVATPQGGIVDTVIDGVTGILVKTGDAGSIAEAVLKLADDKLLRERSGAAARKHYEDKFTARHYGDSLVAALRFALSDCSIENEAAIARTGAG